MPELPKLSAIVKNLTIPEREFENMAKGMGIELPRGPLTTLTTVLESFEKEGAVKPPKLPSLPTLTSPLLEEEEKEIRPMGTKEEKEILSEELGEGEVEEMTEIETEVRGKGRVY